MCFKKIIGAAVFLGALFLFVTTSYAYEGDTHAYLTNEAVKFFDRFSTSTPFDSSLKDYLLDGARHEDSVPRWMNHFYDPVHDAGLSDPVLGTWEASKEWANDGDNQNKLTYKVPSTISSILSAIEKKKLSEISSDTDFTWREAIRHYVSGEKESAMYALGHILHLIEDASVPDHTRNDPHPGDSPYENWTERFTLAHPDPELENRIQGKTPFYFNGLGVYFDSLAEYSNSNFYSRDTIGIQSGYSFPEPEYFDSKNDGNKYGIKTDVEFGNYPLIKSSPKVLSFDLDKEEPFKGGFVLPSYWSRLSTKAVQYAAGVITLFFKEAEAASKNPTPTTPEEKSFFESISNTVGNLFGSIINTVRSAFSGSGSHETELINEIDEDATKSWDEEDQNVITAISPTIFSDKQAVWQGESVTVSGVHFPAESDVVLRLESAFFTTSVTVTTDTNGEFMQVVSFGEEFVPGNYAISARDVSGVQVGNRMIISILDSSEESFVERETDSSTATETVRTSAATSSQKSLQSKTATPQAKKQCSFAASGPPFYTGVLLNEVAWMGSAESANAEWIELKNAGTIATDVSGWQLIDKGEQIKIILPQGSVIPPGGLYLLERTSDDAVPKEKANLIYTGALSNSDEGLRLFNTECKLIDEVIANPNWPAGDAGSRRTMEREASRSWHTFGGGSTNNIWGTPKRENGQALVVYSGGGGGGGGNGGGGNSGGGSSSTPSPTPTPTPISTSTPVSPPPALRINEVMYDAPNSDVSHEWIEIINEGTSTASLADVKLLEGGSRHALTLARGAQELPQGQYAIIADDANTFLADHASPNIAVFDSTFSLSNEGESFALTIGDYTINSFSYASSSGADGNGDSLQYFSGGWEAALPTPGMENVSGVHASSTEEAGDGTPTTAPMANHVVVSEMLFDAEGTDEGKEFVELYNPTDQTKNLTDWSLRYSRGSATTTDSLAVFGELSEGGDRTTIPAHGFLLLGFNSYSDATFGISADIRRTSALLNGGATFDESVRVMLFDAEGNEIDTVRYNADSISSPGESIERKAWKDNVCISSEGMGEFLGNGCGLGSSSVFQKRGQPRPQNSGNLPEPRTSPEFATSSVSVALSENGLNVEISWGRSPGDDEGDGMYYEISDADSETILQEISGTHRWATVLDEIGRTYAYRVRLSDRDGFGSGYGTADVAVPSFLSDMFFYEDISGAPIVDMRFEKYPFIPDVYWDGTNTSWKAVVFYLNHTAEQEEFLSASNDFAPQSADVMRIYSRTCAGGDIGMIRVILPDIADRCSVTGGGLYPASVPLSEDRRFVFPVEGALFSSSDYLTVAWYAFYNSGENTRFKLVATDATQYHFQSAPPPSLSPSSPEGMQIEFNSFHSFITVSPGVSRDEDSPDSSLSYEARVTRDDESPTNDTWRAVPLGGHTSFDVDYPHSYLVESRARDGDGNVSDPAAFSWNFPASYVPLPFQRHREQVLQGVSEQLITITHEADIDGVAMWLGAEGGPYCCSRSKLVVYEDNEDVHGNMIAESAPQSLSAAGYDNALNAQWEVVYEFALPFHLQAGREYWLSIEGTGELSNGMRIYGSTVDAYQYGRWKGDDWKDAYFFLRQAF